MAKNLTVENIGVALRSIKSQRLRAAITMLIIAIGIMALVGILTAIDALKASINDQFTSMGANSFTIEKLPESRITRGGNKIKATSNITYQEAMNFGQQFEFPAIVSTSVQGAWSETIKHADKETNPNIVIYGGDENYIAVKGRTISGGRNFSANEIIAGNKVCILGSEIAKDLFDKRSGVGKEIKIRNIKYQVIGVLKEKGSSMGFSGDRDVIIPVNAVRQYFNRPNMNFEIHVLTNDPSLLEAAVQEATGTFRSVRRDQLGKPASFRIRRSDSLSQTLIENLRYVTITATIIALITLLGAAIGLMNIMLVSVTERTKEIGTRKALGAKQNTILMQFLTEALLICQLGGLFGIVLGIAIGNLVSFLIGSSFIIPWGWMFLGVLLCFLVGIAAGFYPASRAAKLDPIESLRHE